MQGLVTFAAQVGLIFAILLPTFCYAAAIALFLFAAWGFWQQAQPGNPFRGKPWVPWIALFLCGAFATFDRILTKANITGGSSVTVSFATSLSSYGAPSVGRGLLGTGPFSAVVNVVQVFQGFFQSFGAMVCFVAVIAWFSVVRGRSDRSQPGCGVQFVFGIMLINVLTIAQWIAGLFQAGGTTTG